MHIRNKNRKRRRRPSWRMDPRCRKILDRLLAILQRIYQIAGVISTLTIFTAVVLFIAGKIGLETASDDDLIMRDVRKQIPDNLTIADISVEDIHGFGNESLIVLADDTDRYYDEDSRNSRSANQLLVFDKVENSILNQVYNFAGYGSNYKLSYMFSLSSEYLESELAGYMIELMDIVELTGDTSRELVVKFMMCPPGSAGIYEIGVFSYSFDRQAYDLIGTYPPAGVYSLDEGGRKPAPTVFHSETAEHYNFYDKRVCFRLEEGSDLTCSFFAEGDDGAVLVRADAIWGDGESRRDPHRYVVSVFQPRFNQQTAELEWKVVFSKETAEYIEFCTQEIITDFIRANDRYHVLK